jgi:hypothetical protein
MTHLMTMKSKLVALILLLPLAAAAQSIFPLKTSEYRQRSLPRPCREGHRVGRGDAVAGGDVAAVAGLLRRGLRQQT